MTAERRAMIKDLIVESLDVPEETRPGWLAERCGEDEALFREIRDLLESDAPPPRPATESAGEHDDEELEGRLGRYRLLRPLGRGAMGIVYLAEQETPARRVAIKLLRAVMITARSRRRFQWEIEALARLDHPGIARILDAGSECIEGHDEPYIVMEYVEGLDIRRHVEGRRLPRPALIELIARLADAVHHAHVRGVIHRDLKPANILVTVEGAPKILDFGVAKLLEPGAFASDSPSLEAPIIGTPGYLSPEQAAGAASAIDARTDVYALGVIAFELLAGRLPHSLEGLGTLEALRVIREREPLRLASVAPACRGDLDAVIGQALAMEPAERYQSASEFAADLRRLLHDDPVTARRRNFIERSLASIRRNRLASAACACALAALLVGFAVAWQGWNEALRGRAAAERTTAASQRLAYLLTASVRPRQEPEAVDRFRLAAEVLDGIAEGAREALSGAPEIESRLRIAVAEAYRRNGMYDRAASEASRAFAIIDEAGIRDPSLRFRAAGEFVACFAQAGRTSEAWALAQREMLPNIGVVAASPRAAAILHAKVAETAPAEESAWAFAVLKESSETLLREPDLSEKDCHAVAWMLNRGAARLITLGRFDEAIDCYQRAFELTREFLETEHAWASASLQSLGALLTQLGESSGDLPQLLEAERCLREALDIKLRAGAADHVETLVTQHNLARALLVMNRVRNSPELLEEAADLWTRTLATARAIGQERSMRYGRFLTGYAELHLERGELDEAQRLAKLALEIFDAYPDQQVFRRQAIDVRDSATGLIALRGGGADASEAE